MARKPTDIELKSSELVAESEHRTTSMSLPLAIHHRLDVVAESVKGTKASRGEIIAALIAQLSLQRSEVRNLIADYREMTVGDVFPDEPDKPLGDSDEGKIYKFRPRRPGRPRSAAG